jgi:hypothetical protein
MHRCASRGVTAVYLAQPLDHPDGIGCDQGHDTGICIRYTETAYFTGRVNGGRFTESAMHGSRRQFLENAGSVTAAAAVMLGCNEMLRGATFRGEPVRIIGSEPVLLIDHTDVLSPEDVRRKIHPPRKTGDRLIVAEHPWESATLNWFSVLRDGDRYRMWYECYDVDGWPTADDTSFCYAESTDGIHWKKPELGLVSYQGSSRNNILFRQIGEGSYRSRVHGSCVFIDPLAPPAARYRCVSQGLFQGIGDRPYYVAGMSSPDGLHWTRDPQPICHVFADSQYSGFYDPLQKKYVLYGRVAGRGGRAVGVATSDRANQFSPLNLVLQAAENHPADADLYNPACLPWPNRAGLYLMFPSLFRHGEDTLEIHLAVSRDGIQWTWPDSQAAFIPRGDSADFDGGSLYMANGACIPTGNDLSFYFSGSPLKHAEVELENLARPENRRVISRAVAQSDRLVSVTSTAPIGRFVTQPLRFQGTRLIVNGITEKDGALRVELLDESGIPIPGFQVSDCIPLTSDQSAWPVSWKNQKDLVAVVGRTIQLRFTLERAHVFGFHFRDEH